MSDKFQPTGNEFVSLPCIREEDGALLSATFLHMGFRGLVDLGGTEQEPFLKPFLRQKGREIPLKMIDWKREEYWIPTFTCTGAGLEMKGTILSPVGHRGFVYRMEYHNPTNTGIRITAGMCGCWEKCIHAINEDKPIEGTRHAYASHWDESGVFDLRIGISAFAFAISFTGTIEKEIAQQEGEIRYRFSRELNIAPGQTETVDCYFGVGIEEVSALTSGICMRLHGYDRLYAATAEWLRKRARKLTDPALERTMNLNLFFNFFFAEAIDFETFCCAMPSNDAISAAVTPFMQ